MEVKIYNLNISGLNTLLIPMTKTDIISVGMFIKVGSINETKNNNGIAHFLEHLMFKSTIKRPNKKLLNELDNLGTNYNAGTTRDHTYYEINGAKKDINEIIDIILDLYCNPIYETDEIELEKGVILEELKMHLDNTSRSIYDYIISEIFKGTPLEKNIIGTEINIKKFSKEEITNFRKLYTIENSLLVVAGNFEKNKVIDIIKEKIKDNSFNHSKVDDIKITYNINSSKPNVYIIPNKNMNQSYLYISYYFQELTFLEECILNFLSFYFSAGSTSKLFEVLRNKLGSSYSNEVSAFDFQCKNGLFYIYSNINNSLMLESLTEILKIISNLKNINITDEDIKKVKKLFETNNLFQINNPNYLMMYHGKKYLYGKEQNILEEVDIISKLDSKTIKDFCNSFFIKKNLNIFIYGSDIDQSKLANIVNEF
jgi:predicted Zn-dependent peptidase